MTETNTILRLRRTPKPEEGITARYWVAIALVLGGRAIDFIDASHEHRGLRRRSADSLGIPRQLRLSAAATARLRAK